MPKLLDLYCGAGGASRGYADAGFDVSGVDNKVQRRYPYPMMVADAIDILDNWNINAFDAIHASPPCQRYSLRTPARYRRNHPDPLDELIAALERVGKPYVIENTPQAPMRTDLLLCGSMVGLYRIRRHRIFMFGNWKGFFPPLNCAHHLETGVISIAGNHGITNHEEAQEIMGINWMAPYELAEAVPPPYTKLIGEVLLQYLADHPKKMRRRATASISAR